MAEQSDTLGSIGLNPAHYIQPPPVPIIVSEWAGLIPLAFHLASSQDDYTTAGDISLLGRLPVTLFPPLGAFAGVARLMERGTNYLDYASTKGASSQTVWDVKYGGSFPVANGAASAAIVSYLSKKHRATLLEKCYHASHAPRSQILNIYEFGRKERATSSFRILQRSMYWQPVLIGFLVGLCGLFAILGAFGTAAIALTCAVSRAFALSIRFERPRGYLQTTEDYDASMLVAAHRNAMEWHLFTGDRGVVDTLLNKPMIEVPKGSSRTRATSLWFRVADTTQLIAMTFTAANKGWDGLCLVLLLAAHYVLFWGLGRQSLAGDWLKQNDITVHTRCLEFSGRHPMIGTIQVLTETGNARWMDEILESTPRRATWLAALKLPAEESILFDEHLGQDERTNVSNNRKWTQEAVELAKTLHC
ncbi:hypothetical protein LTR33_010396 [Friedmanniomyces endolithicus]|nr:hypothetical protein LTR33_010396 [Friedmanniomyces endolithicus]